MSNYLLIPDLEQLKKEIATTKKQQFYRLADQCDRYFNMPLSNQHPAGSTTYMGIAMINLSLFYLLTEEKKYYEEAMRFIRTVCSYEVWGYAHLVNVDLSASWILFGLSLAYNWLKNYLPQEDKVMIYDKLCLQSKIMYDYKLKTTGKGWSTAYYQNHNWINMTGLACCGYALLDSYLEASCYIQLAKENFDLVYSLLAEDGSNYEGVVYWRYGGMWLFVYADLLKDRENLDYFKTCPYLKNTFYYRISQASADLKRQLNFGDCHDRYSGHSAAVYYKIAKEYRNGYAQTLANKVSTEFLYEEQYQSSVKPGILPEACFELLWYDPTVEEKELNELPKVFYFEDLGLISLRSGYQADATVFSFKCGRPGGLKQWKNGWRFFKDQGYQVLSLSHHHPDNLSFILNKEHAYFYIDDGYNRNILPQHHNVLLVDGKLSDCMNCNDVYMESAKTRLAENPSFDPVASYYGEINYFYTDQRYTFFKGENHLIYPVDLKMKEVSRIVFTDELNYFILIDTFESEKTHAYTSVFNSDCFAEQTSDGYVYRLLNEKLYYRCFSEDEVTVRQFSQEVKSVMTTQEPDNFCRTVLHTLCVDTKPTIKQQLIHTLCLEKEKPISFSGGVLYLDSKTYLLLKPALGYTFDGDCLYVEETADQVKLGIFNGTVVQYQNQVLYDSKHRKSLVIEVKK